MLTHLKSFNGYAFNSATELAVLLNPHGSSEAEPIFIEQANADPSESGLFTVAPQRKVVSVTVKGGNRQAVIRTLKQVFKRGTKGDLVAWFADEAVDYMLPCRVESFIQDPEFPNNFTALLVTDRTAWRGVAADTEATWTVEDAGDTLNLSVAGSDETFLSAALTAQDGPAAGFLYQNIYQLPNTAGLAHGSIPWRITVDTAALVTAGKMQADCDDLRIFDLRTGQELRRWIADPNTSATKVWVVLNLTAGVALPLLTAVADTGDVSVLQFKKTKKVKNQIGKMPNSGVVYRGGEWFYYSAKDKANARLTIAKRGLYGTPLSAHSGGAVFGLIQHPLVMKYGNSSATEPALDDDDYDEMKPLFSLASSSNTAWVYGTADKFFDRANPNRTGAWVAFEKKLGNRSGTFTVKREAESGDPALGLKAASFLSGSTWKAENVTLAWTLFRAAGIIEVSMTGEKYRTNANWLATAGLWRSANGVDYFSLWNEATPASAATWTAFTRNSVAVAAGSRHLRLLLAGGYKAVANAYAILSSLTATVTFSSGNVPTGTFLGEEASYPLELTITNETNGDSVAVSGFPMSIGKVFAMDGEARSVTYDGANSHSAVELNDESRAGFIRLVGGVENVITIAGDDLGELDVDLSYFRRRL